MKKILRILGSRYFLVALCLLLEVAQMTTVFVFLRNRFIVVNILGWALQLVVLIYIVNRDEIPEFKLPWLFLLLLIPVTGAFLFLFLSRNEASKKQRRRHDDVMTAMEPYSAMADDSEQLKAEDLCAYRQVQYLRSAGKVPCFTGTDVAYYPLGELFHPALLEALESAEHFIFMEYFMMQEGVMFDPIHDILRRKVEQGVEVYFMYDDFGCFAFLSDKYYKVLQADGIHAIPSNKLRPIFSKSYNNRDHRKITVVDGKIGFAGGINLCDRYMNAEVVYGHWKDSAVRLEGPAVRTLTALFISAWNIQSDDPLDVHRYMDIAPEPLDVSGFTVPFGDGPPPLYPDRIGKNVYLGIIYDAKTYVYITTPYLICDHEILSALRIAARRGVDVRIITPHIPDKKLVFLLTRSNYRQLVDDGVKVYEYTPGFIHAKNFIADDRIAVCGSINLDYRSLVHNYENAVWMYGLDCIRDMRDDFMDTVAKSEEITPEMALLPAWERIPAELMKLLSTLM